MVPAAPPDSSIETCASTSAARLANLWVGWLAERMGASATIGINGFCMLTIALLMLLRPGLTTWVPVPEPHGGKT